MYAYNKTNVAYDLSHFETDERAAQRAKKRSESHIKMYKVSVAKSGNWFKTIVLVAVGAILAFAFINGKAIISELSIDISAGTAALEEAKTENARLQAELDNIVSISKVDEIATTTLGLQKTSKSQVRYISVYDRSMVQVADSDGNVFSSIQNWFNSTAEYLGF